MPGNTPDSTTDGPEAAATTTTTKTTDTTDATRRPRWRRRVLGGVVALLVLLVVLVGIAPMLASTGWGNQFIEDTVNAQLDGSIETSSISIGWFAGPRVTGFVLKNSGGETLATVAAVEAPSASLVKLISGDRGLGDVRVRDLQADIVQRADGSLNIIEPFSKLLDKPADDDAPDGPTKVPASASIDFAFTGQNRVTFAAPNMDTLTVDLSQLTLVATDPNDMVFDLAAAIRQGQRSGSLTLTADVQNIVNSQNQLQLTAAVVNAEADMMDLPVEPLDRLAMLGGALEKTLGPLLRARVQASGPLDALKAEVLADTQHMKANTAFAAQQTEAGPQTQLAEEGTIRLTLTPEAMAAWRDHYNLEALAVLPDEAVDVTVTLRSFKLGQKNGKPNLAGAEIGATVNVGPMVFDAGETVGRFRVFDTMLGVNAARLGDDVALALATWAQHGQETGSITLDAEVDGLGAADGSLDPWAEKLNMIIDGQLSNLPVALADHITKLEGLLVEAIGPEVNGRIQAALKPNASDAPPGDLVFELASKQASANLTGQYAPAAQLLSLTGPATFNASPRLIAMLQRGEDDAAPALTIAEAAVASFDLKTLQLPIATLDPSKARVALELSVQPIDATVQGIEGVVRLDRFKLDVPEVTLDQTLAGTFEARLVQGNDILPVNASIKVYDALSVLGARAEIEGTANPVSVLLIDRIAGLDGQATALLGDLIDRVSFNAQGRLLGGLSVDANVQANSDRLASNIDVKMTPKAFVIEPGSTVNIELPADAADAVLIRYVGDSALLKVSDAMAVIVSLNGVTLPRASEGVDLPGLAADVDVTLPHLAMEQAGIGSRIVFKDVVTKVKSDRLGDRATLTTNGRVRVTPRDAASDEPFAPLDVLVDAREMFDEQGAFSTDTLTADVEANLAEFPVAIADHLAKLNGLLLTTLGPEAKLAIAGKFPGPIKLDGESNYATVNLPFDVSRDLTITLGGDALATLQVTAETVKGLLGDLHPAFGDAVGSEQPVKLTIYQKGFELPMGQGFDLAQLKVSGKLEAGTIRMAKAGWVFQGLQGVVGQLPGVGGALNLLGGGGKEPAATQAGGEPAADFYRVNFSPMDFSLGGGIVETSELWITSDTLATGFQGKADLINDQVQMVMGVLGASLISQQLGVHSVAEKFTVRLDQVLDVPVTGSLNNPTPDVGYVTLQLAGSGARKLSEADPTGISTAIIDAVGGQVIKDKQKKLDFTWSPPQQQINEIVASASKRIDVIQKDPRSTTDSDDKQATQDKPKDRKAVEDELRDIGESLLNDLLRTSPFPGDRERRTTPREKEKKQANDADALLESMQEEQRRKQSEQRNK